MRITIPYAYDWSVIPHRARNAKEYQVHGKTVVDIKELSREEFPLAVRAWDRFGKLLEYRAHEGEFYLPVQYEKTGSEAATVTIEALMLRIEEGKDYCNPFHSAQRCHYMRNAVEASKIEWREEVSSNENKVLQDIDDVAQNLIIMDGLVLKKVPEPTLAFTRGVGWHVCEWPSSNPREVYRLDETHMKIFENTAEAGYEWADKFEVMMPEMLKYDAATPAVLDLIGRLADRNDGYVKYAYEWTKEQFAAYADCRDILKAAPGVVTSDLLEAAARYYEVFGHNEAGAFLMAEAIERWDNRPAPSVEELQKPKFRLGG